LTLLAVWVVTTRAQDGATVIRAASAAMGNPKSVQYSGTGWNSAMGQSFMPSEDWPKFELKTYMRALDYDARSSREEWERVQGNFPPRGGGGIPVYDWPASVNGVWTQKFYVSGDFAWNVDGTTVSNAPRLSTSAAGMLRSIRQLDIWLSPHGALRAAMAAKDATVLPLNIDGQNKNLVSFTTMDKYRINLTLSSDNMVERVQTWVQNPVFGDMVFEYAYSDYKDYGGVKFPSLIRSFQGDARLNPGHSFSEIKVANVQINPALPPLPVPDTIAKAAAAPAAARIQSSQMAPGLFRIAGEGHHSFAVDFRDFIAVIEAPQDEVRSLGVIAEIHKLIPNKPIRYVVNTHHHFDHSGGLRTYVAQGATVVTHAANKDFFEKVMFYPTPRTLEPDLFSKMYPWFREDRVPLVEPVTDKYVISDGTRMLDVYALTGMDEANHVVAFLPAEKILFNADLYGPPAGNAAAGKASANERQLAANIKRLKLTVERHAGVHGDVGPNSTFVASLGSAGN